MGRQIIKQPNGKYCIFSTVVDSVTDCNMTVEEIIEKWVDELKKDVSEKVYGIISSIEKNEKPYHQFTMSYDEMIVHINLFTGKKEADKVKSLIECTNNI